MALAAQAGAAPSTQSASAWTKADPMPEQDEIARLQREVGRLEAKLAHAEAIIDIQKKVSALLGLPPLEQ